MEENGLAFFAKNTYGRRESAKKERSVILKCKKTAQKRLENAKNTLFLFIVHKNSHKSSSIFYIEFFKKNLSFLLKYGRKCGILNGSDVR